MHGISRLAGTLPGLAPERSSQRDDALVQSREDTPRQRPDTITLRGKALAGQVDPMSTADAQALLQRIVAEPGSLLQAHDALSPASVARLLELDVV